MTQQPDPTATDRDTRHADRRAQRREQRGGGVGGIVFGTLLVILGVIFLLQALDVWTVRGDVVWPLILIALGTAAVLNQVLGNRGRSDEG